MHTAIRRGFFITDSELKLLKSQIKDNKLSSLYVFFGDESYLIEHYTSQIAELVPNMGFPDFNRLSFDGKSSSLSEIAEAINSFPMMADRKLIIIDETGAFGAKSASDVKEYYNTVFKQLSDDTVLIIKEHSVDKRSTVYKTAKKYGVVVEFKRLSDSDLSLWIMREVGRKGKKITRENADLLVSICEKDLMTLNNEINKLCSYAESEITTQIIKKLASKSLEAKVFDLCDYIMSKKPDKALKAIDDLRTNKESPYAILYLLYTTFERVLKTRLLLNSRTPKKDISSLVGIPFFAVDKYINGAKTFSEFELINLVSSVPEYDLMIKRGEIDQWKAVESLIFTAIGGANEKI